MPHLPLPAFACWAGPRRAKILAIGEAHGREESESAGRPFVGEAGKEMWRLLGEAWPEVEPGLHRHVTSLHRYGIAWVKEREGWLAEASLAFTNVLNFRPEANKLDNVSCAKGELPQDYPKIGDISRGKYLRPEYLGELTRLREEIRACTPNLILALGNTACWAVLGEKNISQIRGTVRPAMEALGGIKVLPTWHPASLLYEGQWSRRPIVLADLMKALREAEFPEIRRPSRRIIIEPELDDVRAFVGEVFQRPPQYLGVDTETSLGLIDTISFATSRSSALACQVGPHRIKRGESYQTIWPQRHGQRRIHYWDEAEEEEFWHLVRQMLESPLTEKVFQNGMYDLQYLLKMGIRPANCSEDPMLLHHALFPELQKGLGFLGSIYTAEPAWKLMRGETDTEKRDE